MDKIEFTKLINAIKQGLKEKEEFAEAAGVLFPNAFVGNLIPKESPTEVAIIHYLETYFNDSSELIKYFIWELDFGKAEYSSNCIKDAGVSISLTNAGELYEYLMTLKKAT